MSKPGSPQDQLDGMDALWRDARDKIAALEAENARLWEALNTIAGDCELLFGGIDEFRDAYRRHMRIAQDAVATDGITKAAAAKPKETA